MKDLRLKTVCLPVQRYYAAGSFDPQRSCGNAYLPEEASCPHKSYLHFIGRLPFRKTLYAGEEFTLRCINREDWVQAPPAREDWLPALPGGGRLRLLSQ